MGLPDLWPGVKVSYSYTDYKLFDFASYERMRRQNYRCFKVPFVVVGVRWSLREPLLSVVYFQDPETSHLYLNSCSPYREVAEETPGRKEFHEAILSE